MILFNMIFLFCRRMDTKDPMLVEAGDIAPQLANVVLAVACCVGKGAPDFRIEEVIKQLHLRVCSCCCSSIWLC